MLPDPPIAQVAKNASPPMFGTKVTISFSCRPSQLFTSLSPADWINAMHCTRGHILKIAQEVQLMQNTAAVLLIVLATGSILNQYPGSALASFSVLAASQGAGTDF